MCTMEGQAGGSSNKHHAGIEDSEIFSSHLLLDPFETRNIHPIEVLGGSEDFDGVDISCFKICPLCQRAFTSKAALDHHTDRSELHALNLLMRKAEEAAAGTSSAGRAVTEEESANLSSRGNGTTTSKVKPKNPGKSNLDADTLARLNAAEEQALGPRGPRGFWESGPRRYVAGTVSH